jgi:hypothetical protein
MKHPVLITVLNSQWSLPESTSNDFTHGIQRHVLLPLFAARPIHRPISLVFRHVQSHLGPIHDPGHGASGAQQRDFSVSKWGIKSKWLELDQPWWKEIDRQVYKTIT